MKGKEKRGEERRGEERDWEEAIRGREWGGGRRRRGREMEEE